MSKNGTGSNWTPPRIAQLEALWQSGNSAGLIASLMGGFETNQDGGRNAIIGKLHRLGLTGQGRPRHSMPRAAKRWRELWPREEKRPAPVARVKTVPPPPPACEPVLFLARRSHQCAWPLWGNDPVPVTEKTCCGASVRPGGPYCGYHHAICNVGAPPKKPHTGIVAEFSKAFGHAPRFIFHGP